jgi:hypothetical protein
MRLGGMGGALVAGVLLVPGAAAVAAPSIVAWDVALDRIGGGDVNVTYARGGLTVAGGSAESASVRLGRVSAYKITRRTTTAPVNRVRADVAAATPAGTAVIVEVRAELGPRRWSEWAEVPATLPDATVLEVRISLDGPATFKHVRISAERAQPLKRPLALGNAYRVFATREGLVGGTTANGHVITSRDHFVALPSRRGLSPKNTGDYTVRVCAASGRCEWVPVWDVGPWNITDDYWWVRGTVRTTGSTLTVRNGPRVGATAVGMAANYARPIIECKVSGDTVTGTYGTTNLWDRLAPGYFVSDAYVGAGSARTC